MIVTHRRFWRAAATLGLIVGVAPMAQAVGWLDNFNDGSVTDGNPVSWVNDLGGSTLFPGDYNATSGDFVMKPAADDVDSSIMISFVPVSFTDVYIRTQGIVLPDPEDPETNKGGNLVLVARLDPATLSAYIVYFDVSGNLNLQYVQGETQIDIGTTFDAPFNAGSEVIVELNVVGDQLSAYAWEVNDPNGKPAEPQVTATDTEYSEGFAGLIYAEDDDKTTGVFRYAAAQDTPFVDAAPGDFDNDGDVDGADFVLGQRNAFTTSSLTAFTANYGAGGAPISPVPEPSSLLLATVLALGGVRCMRHRK